MFVLLRCPLNFESSVNLAMSNNRYELTDLALPTVGLHHNYFWNCTPLLSVHCLSNPQLFVGAPTYIGVPSVQSSMATIPGREVDVTYGEHTLRMFLDMGVGIGGDKWPAADTFCNMITCPEWTKFFGTLFDGKRILELGSGNGVVGILIDKAYTAKEICITDLSSHTTHIERNTLLNSCSPSVSVVPFDWADDIAKVDESLRKPFDVILALECVYREDLYLPLINAIKQESHANTLCFLGSTRQFTRPLFFRMLEENGLTYKKLPTQTMLKGTADESIGMFVIHACS